MVEDALGLEQFELREQPIPELKGGQALVRVKLINVHSNSQTRIALGMTALGRHRALELRPRRGRAVAMPPSRKAT